MDLYFEQYRFLPLQPFDHMFLRVWRYKRTILDFEAGAFIPVVWIVDWIIGGTFGGDRGRTIVHVYHQSSNAARIAAEIYELTQARVPQVSTY